MKRLTSLGVVVSVVVVLTTAGIMATFGVYEYRLIRSEEMSELGSVTEVVGASIARNVAAPLYNLDMPVVKEIVRNAMAFRFIHSIVLLDENGTTLSYGVGRDKDWEPVEVEEVTHDGLTMERTWPVQFQEEELGFLRVLFTTRFLREKLNRYLMQALMEIGLLIGLLALVIILLMRKLLIRPVQRLQEFAEWIREGKLDEDVGRATFLGELKGLRGALAAMAEELLHSLVVQIKTAGVQVRSSATEISASARQLEGTIAQQASSINEVNATSTEISSRATELAETMNEVMKVARDTAGRAEEGREGLSGMEESMRSLVEATGAISGKLSAINEKAGNIGAVVTTINKIAEQTNLLSLNAAIEAEKAGEYGKGFAVVAREIRRLADRTAVSTLKIEDMVKQMQSAVSSGVMEMDKFVQRVRRGVEEVESIGEGLAKVIEQVQALFPRYEEVNRAMQEQSTGAGEISTAMDRLSGSAGQTRESLQEFNQAGNQLIGAVQALQDQVERFRV